MKRAIRYLALERKVAKWAKHRRSWDCTIIPRFIKIYHIPAAKRGHKFTAIGMSGYGSREIVVAQPRDGETIECAIEKLLDEYWKAYKKLKVK